MFRKKQQGTQTELIGVLVQEELVNCIKLQVLLQGKNKSRIVRSIIERYADANGWTEASLVKRYADYLHSLWHLRYRETKEFSVYLEETQIELLKGGKISVTLVIEIIKECDEQRKNQLTNKSKPE